MKKYKLIKEYPGSPEIGEIFIADNSINAVFKSKYYPGIILNYIDVENTEFFEEIKEKEYKITAFKSNSNITDLWIKDINKGEAYWSRRGKNTIPYTTEEILTNKNYNIYSVKRLSDNIEFKIDDKIIFIKFGYKITGFYINSSNCGDKICVKVERIASSIKKEYELASIQHFKQPVFKTIDGVDIYEGDKGPMEWFGWPYVDTKEWKIAECATNSILTTKPKIYEYCKVFSTKELAEEYITMNKPCLSLKEVEDIFYEFKSDFFIKKLRNIVKNKLK